MNLNGQTDEGHAMEIARTDVVQDVRLSPDVGDDYRQT